VILNVPVGRYVYGRRHDVEPSIIAWIEKKPGRSPGENAAGVSREGGSFLSGFGALGSRGDKIQAGHQAH